MRPDFVRNADWLLEQCHKIWLAVGINGSWKRLFLAWLFSRMIRRRRREGSILLSFLFFYGLMVRKYALIYVTEIREIHMVVHTFSGFALFTQLMWVYRGVESLCKLLTASNRYLLIYQQTRANQNTVHLKTDFIWKFSREWLLWTGYSSGGSLRTKHQIANCEVLDEKYRIAVQGIFVGIIIKAGGASLKVTDLSFVFAFCKK